MRKIIFILFISTGLWAEFYAKTFKVEQKSISEHRSFYGRIEANEDLISSFTLRVDGFVEDLKVSKTYMQVKKDTLLFSLYSPELLQAQNEFINALQYKSNVASTKQKLLLLGMDERVIAQIEKTRSPLVNVPFFSKTQGFVFEKKITQGEYLKKGERVYQFWDLSSLYFLSQVPQEQMAFLSEIKEAKLQIKGIKEDFELEFLEVLPQVAQNQFVEVRFLLKNPHFKLFPNLFGVATLYHAKELGLFLPKECVLLRNGKLYVFIKDLEGNFTPTLIEAIRLADGNYKVLSGVQVGDEVALNALFILDADAQIDGDE